ncbi:MAG: N-acetylglucosamine-6-phosphate deacetylase, partial [Armatimonadetes bacterium]|nr:N-acetylglucosamine-6-phosphate deacetylase [Armatimonadota bacterium]
MTMPLRVCGRLCDTGEVATLSVAGGRIAGFRVGAEEVDLGGPDLWLSPGFLDLQLNGYGGHDFNQGYWGGAAEGPHDLRPIFESAARAGTALLCPTMTTNSAESIAASLSRLSRTLDADPQLAARVPGLHLEGPYLSSEDGPRGAHPREYVR